MQTKLRTKAGWLTPYALACGYIEVNVGWNDKRIATMYHEHGVYHVKAFDTNELRDYWKSFDNLADARKAYMQQLKQRNAKRTIDK